jgi:Ni/Fe-hydrogenase 1 B-type cytochrome subunit
MRAAAIPPPEEEVPHPAARGTRIRIYVWDLVVRNTHWVIALAMAILVVSGLYIAHPFGHPGGTPSPYFLMGWVRVVHFYAAIVFTLAVLLRVAWYFLSPIVYARWKQFIPVQRYRRRELLTTIKFYTFFRKRPPDVIGHNPLAGLSYSGVFVLYFLMITSGLALYAGEAIPGAFMKNFQFFVSVYGGLQTARFVHHVVMWVLILFVTLHVYLNALTSSLEENGEVDSIFSGYKFVPRHDVEKELADEAAETGRGKRA